MTARKFLAVFLALILCLGTLSACQQTPAETTAPSSETTKPAETTAPATQETTEPAPLTNAEFYPISSDHIFQVAVTRENAPTADCWNLMVDTIGLDVEWQVITSEQTPLLFVGGSEMPDMFIETAGISQAQIKEYGQGGLLVNYADYLDQMPNLQRWLNAHPKMIDTVVDDAGNFYTLPCFIKTLTMGGTLFYVRTDHTAAAGWDTLPATTEEFLTMCEDLKNHYADVEGYIPMVCNGPGSMKYNGAYANFLFPSFGELMEPGITTNAGGTKIEVGFVTEQFKHYLEFMYTLYEKGYMDPECFTADGAVGKAKMMDGSTTMNPFATYLTKNNFASGELDFQVMPAMTSQYQSEARWPIPNYYQARVYMISTSCPDIDAAIKFMDAFYADEEHPLNEEGTIWGISMWLGELGVDFTRNDEEGWYVIEDHEGFDSGSAWLSASGSGSAVTIDWFWYENSETGTKMKALGQRDILYPDGVEVFPISMLVLTQDEQDIYNDVWTDINNYVTEMNAAFITGQKDLQADWDTYVKTLQDMGIQDVIDVYQAALDRYNAG